MIQWNNHGEICHRGHKDSLRSMCVDCAVEDRAEADTRLAEAVGLLVRLANEVGGTLLNPSWEREFRAMAGNTNFQCIKERWEEAKAYLDKEGEEESAQ